MVILYNIKGNISILFINLVNLLVFKLMQMFYNVEKCQNKVSK